MDARGEKHRGGSGEMWKGESRRGGEGEGKGGWQELARRLPVWFLEVGGEKGVRVGRLVC
jgi:hypothetical protein